MKGGAITLGNQWVPVMVAIVEAGIVLTSEVGNCESTVETGL